MNRFFKRFVSILVVTFLFVGLNPAQSVFATTDNSKMITLSVTQCQSFTDSDWQALGNSNSTDFVIIPLSAYNYGSNQTGYINQLAPIVINAINQLVSKRSSAKIWIGTPGIDSTNYSIASTSLDPFYNYTTYIQTQIGTTIWSNNIRGVYMNEEAVYGPVDYSNLMGNATIKLMNDLSYRVHTNLSKKFLWIPYYGYGSDPATIIKNIGYVTNKNTIYDYVMIQPHYYFDSTVQSNLNGVYFSVNNQAVSYRDGVIVTPKTSSTIIGVEMECDWHIVPPNSYSDYQGRYNEYVSKFSGFKGSYPFAFYWDGTLTSALNSLINPFYNY
jgi:hypothetical protein